MKQFDFVKKNRPTWDIFENALAKSEIAQEQDMPKLYRQICQDLATAQARQYSPEIIHSLNTLLLSGQTQIYKTRNRIIGPLLQFFSVEFAQSLTDIRAYLIWAHVLFYGFLVASATIVALHPDAVHYFLDKATMSSIQSMYDPSSAHFAKERASDSDFLMFGHYIRNNISIAFQCFAGGLVLGIGSLFYLIYNAIFIGAISGYIITIDYGSTFFSFVVTHGAFELTAIVLSAAAGGVIGKHLIAPGQLSRVESLKLAGKRAFPVVLGCFVMLILAAFVEAFWSSSRIVPNDVKYIVGALCWAFILWFVFKPGKQLPTKVALGKHAAR